jgi:hypothetical protein
MRFARLRALYADRTASHRVTCGADAGAVSIPCAASSTDRPPALANRVHSLVSPCLFGVPSPLLLAAPFGAAVLPGGSCPLRDITVGVHSLRELPGLPLRSVHRFSQPLDGLLHLPALRAYCIPQPRPGFRRPGGSPDPQPSLARRQGVPPCRCRPPAHRQAGCHVRTPRLRGFAPWIGAFREGGV